MSDRSTLPTAVRWDRGRLYLLDQTQLPGRVVEQQQRSIEQVRESIRQLKVRGAPALAIAAAYGLVVGLESGKSLARPEFDRLLQRQADYLASSRPTAVNLAWALDRLRAVAARDPHLAAANVWDALEKEAVAIHEEDKRLCEALGRHGLPLIREGGAILTHCNAGALATSSFGTATAPMYMAHAEGRRFRVFSDETRPLLQGARLTAWELNRAGIDVTLICDSAAAHMMSTGAIDTVVVGTDRVAANGDVANKIGTLSVAIAAHHFGIPFYVACPYSTIDFNTADGAGIVIEQRDADEVTELAGHRTAPPDVRAINPAFDVTPHHLVTGIITEVGILHPPYDRSLRTAYGQ